MNRLPIITFPLAVFVVFTFLVSTGWSTGPEPGYITGKYSWETDDKRAELEVELLPFGKVHVRGTSFWGMKQESGPATGEFDFTAPIENGRVKYSEKLGMGNYYRLELTFAENGLYVKEEGISRRIGMHAKFEGEYSKQ